MRFSLAALLALLAGGCSWLNAPNGNLTPPDAGVDGGGIELFCDDGLDDDEDLAFDCDDADCAQEPACCELRSPTLSEDWAAANLGGGSIFAPTAEAAWSPLRPSLDGTTFVGGFLPDDSPRALVSRDCVSLALGGWVGATLRSTDSAGCAADAICERYAGIALTVANDSAPGSKLQDELAVSLHAGGLVLVTQSDVEVARTTTGVDENVEIEIELRPTLDEANLPILKASVTVDSETILGDFKVMGIADLLSSGDCAEIPGLRLAAQGRGDEVYVGPLVSAKQNCANPSQFDEQSATLTGSTLEFTPSWVEAYVGSPALASSRNSVSDVQWDLIVEGSNFGPELEPTTHIGYALGHARVATDEGGDWGLDGWESSASPKLGADPPACLDGSCDVNRSVREPHLLAELNAENELRDLVLSFARELVTEPSERDLFGIQIIRPVGGPSTAVTLPTAPTISPSDIPVVHELARSRANSSGCRRGSRDTGCSSAACRARARLPKFTRFEFRGRSKWCSKAPSRCAVWCWSRVSSGRLPPRGLPLARPLMLVRKDGMRLRISFLTQRHAGDWAVGAARGAPPRHGDAPVRAARAGALPREPGLSNRSTLVRAAASASCRCR